MATAEPEPQEQEQPEPLKAPEPENPDAEPDEDGEPDEAEPEPEPEPHEPSTETVLAERHKALASETRRHENALRKIYGDDFAELQPCPLCLTDGWVIPAPPGAFPDEQWEAVKLACGHDETAHYPPAKYTELCPDCEGWGMLDTGAHTGEAAIIVCRGCQGLGFREKIATAPAPIMQLAPVTTGNGTQTQFDPNAPKDTWGRPAGHPHFGIEPAYVS